MKSLLQFILLLSLLSSCKQNNSAEEVDNGLRFYTAKSIDSLVSLIDKAVADTLSKDDTTFAQFVSAKERRKLVNNYKFRDFTRMIYYIQKDRLQNLSIKKFYFDQDQLIKISFSRISGFSTRMLGSYYYSKEKVFLLTTSNRSLPKPDAALEQAKYYLKQSD